MTKHMEFYIRDDAASIQIGKNVYKRVSIPIDDFNAACDHYGFVKERTCRIVKTPSDSDFLDDWRYRCSECGGNIPVNERDPKTGDVINAANYCPNCGAKVADE